MPLCLALLTDPAATREDLCFAAQTIAHNSRKNADASEVLLSSLAPLAKHFSSFAPVAIQLGLAIANALLRTNFQEAGPGACPADVLADMVSSLAGSPEACLRVLTVLPEELATSPLAPPQRATWAAGLKAKGADILMSYIAATASGPLMAPCCSCLCAWVVAGHVGWMRLESFFPTLVCELHASPEPAEPIVDLVIAISDLHSPPASAAVLEALLQHPARTHAAISRLLVCSARSALSCPPGEDLWGVMPAVLQALLALLQTASLELLAMALEYWADAAEGKHAWLTAETLQCVIWQALECGAYPRDYAAQNNASRTALHDARNDIRNALRPMVAAHVALVPWLASTMAAAMQQYAVAGDWLRFEAVVHAATALSRQLFDPKVAGMLADQLAILTATISTPAFPALQRTVITLLGLLGDWLVVYPAQQPAALHSVTASMQLREWDAVYPMRLHEDHVAGVALVKLTRGMPCGSAAFDEIAVAYRALCIGPGATMTHKSARLVLQALCQMTESVGGAAAAQDIASFAFQSLVSQASPDTVLELLADIAIVLGHCRGVAWPGAAGVLALACGEGAALSTALISHACNAKITAAVKAVCVAALVHAPAEADVLPVVRASCALFAPLLAQSACDAGIDVLRCCIEASAARPDAHGLAQSICDLVLSPHVAAQLAARENGAIYEAVFNFFACIVRLCPAVLAFDRLLDIARTAVHAISTPSPASHTQGGARALLAFLHELMAADAARGLAVALLEREGSAICFGLLAATAGGVPSWALDDIIVALRDLYTLGGEHATVWMTASVACEPFVHKGGLDAFVADLQRAAADRNWPRFKNSIKHFCGGKKKGTAGTPAKGRP